MMICVISQRKVTGIVLHLIINYVNISNKPSAVTNVVICNAVGVVPFIYWYFIKAFHTENVQHLRR